MKSINKELTAILSVAVNVFLAVSKIIVGLIFHSISVLADGLHSMMDVVSSFIGYIGIKLAKKPVDEKHPYGHYKFEVLSGLFVTLLLFLTGVWTIYEAYQSFLTPSKLIISPITLGVMGLSAIINELMARLKISVGKRENSITLLSDGVHSRADVLSSVGVFIGLLLSNYWVNIDGVIAVLIGLYIIKESFSLGKEATDSLLDVSAGKEIEDKIKEIVKEKKIELSELKTQKKGSAVTANLVIKLPKELSVEQATKISNQLKEELIKRIPKLVYVAIQIESHDITSGVYQTPHILGFGRRYGWQRKGISSLHEAQGKGPGGYCICPNCGYKVKHKRGEPCATLTCPRCGEKLRRG